MRFLRAKAEERKLTHAARSEGHESEGAEADEVVRARSRTRSAAASLVGDAMRMRAGARREDGGLGLGWTE